MKKISLIILMLILLFTACNNNGQGTNFGTDTADDNIGNEANENEEESGLETEESIENCEIEIDKIEYFTGEVITDGNYEISTEAYGSICFVPDMESKKLIEKKYSKDEIYFLTNESYFLIYDNFSIVENMPKELGIYKVKVKIDLKNINDYNRFNIIDIQLTDNIGTVYEGKDYETNNLDYDVKVKDTVSGLIVDSVNKNEDGGIIIGFCGEIETEGYYSILYNEMYGEDIGFIYYDEKYFDRIPIFNGERINNNLYFRRNEIFDELINNSSFGRGRFKTSSYRLVHNVGIGREPADTLTEIISLNEKYKNMFVYNRISTTEVKGYNDDIAIVSETKYDEKKYPISFDYYYINKNDADKIFMFTTGYYYELKEVINDREIILTTNGYNTEASFYDEPHDIRCKITDKNVIIEKIVSDL